MEQAKACVKKAYEIKENKSLVAIDYGENLIGFFVVSMHDEVVDCGPFVVDKHYQGYGIAKNAISELLIQCEKEGKNRFQLVANVMTTNTFSLYYKLGFQPQLLLSYFSGLLLWDKLIEEKKTLPDECLIRLMGPSDVIKCNNLHKACNGTTRMKNITASLINSSNICIVAEDITSTEIVGYSTGFHIEGHTLALSEQIWKALLIFTCEKIYARKDKNYKTPPKGETETDGEMDLTCFHISSHLYPDLILWVYENSFRLLVQNILMTKGYYQPPAQPYIYSPSIDG